MFVSESDGGLYDDSLDIIRQNFSIHRATIESIADVKATLRAGEYIWPGGYRLAFVTTDGGVLSFDAVRKNLHNVIWSMTNRVHDGWNLDCILNVNDCDEPIYCDDSGELLN